METWVCLFFAYWVLSWAGRSCVRPVVSPGVVSMFACCCLFRSLSRCWLLLWFLVLFGVVFLGGIFWLLVFLVCLQVAMDVAVMEPLILVPFPTLIDVVLITLLHQSHGHHDAFYRPLGLHTFQPSTK